MNRQRFATNRNQREKQANAEWGRAEQPRFARHRRQARRARRNHSVHNSGPHARFTSGAAVGIGPESVSSPLGTADRRQALLALRARLQGNVVRTAEAVLSGDGPETKLYSPDTADSATEVVEQNLAVSLLGSATTTLDQIDTALRRIEEGHYDRCLDCGERIPAARLEAVPYATRCVQCAARQEQVA